MGAKIAAGFKRYEWTLVMLGFFTWGIIFMDRLAVSFLMPIIQPYFEITNAQVGMISFVTSACYAVSAIVLASLVARASHKKIWLVIFVLGTALASGLCCLTRSYEQLLVARAFVGICEGPVLPLIYSFVANSSSENTYGRNTGIINAGVACIGATLGPIFVTQLTLHFDWQMTFLLSSIPTFIMVLLLIGLVREHGVDKETGKVIKEAPGLKPEVVKVEEPKEKATLGSMLKNRNFVLCCLIQILACGGYWIISAYASLYLTEVSGMSMAIMGFAASAMGLLTILWDILIPKLSDNFGRKPLCIIGYFCAILAPLAMFLFPGGMFSVVMFIIFGGFFGAAFAIVAGAIPNESLSPAQRTTGIAIVMGLGDFLGAACLPLLGGVIADAKGLAFMMVCGVIVGVLATLLSCFLKESNPNSRSMRKKLAAQQQEEVVAE